MSERQIGNFTEFISYIAVSMSDIYNEIYRHNVLSLGSDITNAFFYSLLLEMNSDLPPLR